MENSMDPNQGLISAPNPEIVGPMPPSPRRRSDRPSVGAKLRQGRVALRRPRTLPNLPFHSRTALEI